MIIKNLAVKQSGKAPETLISLEDAIKALRSEIQFQQIRAGGQLFGEVTLKLPYRGGLMTQFHLVVDKILKASDVDSGKPADRI